MEVDDGGHWQPEGVIGWRLKKTTADVAESSADRLDELAGVPPFVYHGKCH